MRARGYTSVAVTLAEINAMGEREFVEQLGQVFEHSPWVAQRAWRRRPFASVEALHRAMQQAVGEASRDEQLALVRAHPELAGAEAREGSLTPSSSGEQGRLGFTRLSLEEFQTMQNLNHAYRDKFGFPCIVALKLHDNRQSVMSEMDRRLANDAPTEFRNALEQIGHIAHARLQKMMS